MASQAVRPLPRNIGVVALSLEQCESGAHPGDEKDSRFCMREHVLHHLLP
jgi:hypothetical protein